MEPPAARNRRNRGRRRRRYPQRALAEHPALTPSETTAGRRGGEAAEGMHTILTGPAAPHLYANSIFNASHKAKTAKCCDDGNERAIEDRK